MQTSSNDTFGCVPSPRHGCRRHAGRPPVWRRGVLLLALAALLTPLIASAATNWWNDDWQYRKAITMKLPAMAASAGAPSAVVLPIRLHAGIFSYFQDLQSGGADLRFVADNGTPLNYQLELLDPAAGLLVAWIEVPIKPGPSERPIWMYYGNVRATRIDEMALYDPDQTVVLRFAELQGLPRDATANRYDVTTSTARLGVPGVIGTGARLDGHSALRIAARPGLAVTANGGLSFAAWVQLDSDSPRAVLYSQAQGDRHLEIGVSGLKLYAEAANAGRTSRVESTAPLALGRWQHVAVSIGTETALYIDGAPAGNAATSGLPAVNGDVFIGALDEASHSGAFTGQDG